ncbi:hypothetical protein WAI453_009398 [Rhynchosporium graminicola]|uniref:Extracellular membrane protein CFEM domain-containing protein n=1 Tax=Rhynchosporium graminicola TaxID=2792576 RepID=A0A1E1LIJ5_9HELO|nr:uncharacterized protein RCO7_02897 [Rhynchosporium commune]
MRIIPNILALAFHALGAVSQTITHITQISIFSDLPSCLTNAVGQVYEGLRTSECPQANPASAASCICLKTANSAGISFSMSILVPIWCAAGGGNEAGLQENFSSGLAVFSEYCVEARAAGTAGPAATATNRKPADTAAGKTTTAPVSGSTSTNSNNQNNAPDPAPTPPSSSSSSPPGLSLGEKLAIGVTIPATLAAIVGCYFAWRQHQRGKREAEMRKAAYQQAQFQPGPPSYALVQRHGQ